MIKLFFKYTRGVILERVPLTVGTVGLDCSFGFSDEWDGLTKTAVFDGSGVTKDVILLENTVDVPPEVLAEAGGELRIGVYGMDGDGNVVIPTMYVTAGAILESADPDKDPSTDGSLEVWAQTLNIALDAQKKAAAAEAAAIGEKESAKSCAEAAEKSKAAAQTSETKAKEYSDAANEAANQAHHSALNAAEYESNAVQAKSEAQNAASRAGEYAADSENSRIEAEKAKTDSQKYADMAYEFAGNASANVDAARHYASKAEGAAERAENAGGGGGGTGEPGKSPYIGDNGNWFEYDGTQYVDTGVKAQGDGTKTVVHSCKTIGYEDVELLCNTKYHFTEPLHAIWFHYEVLKGSGENGAAQIGDEWDITFKVEKGFAFAFDMLADLDKPYPNFNTYPWYTCHLVQTEDRIIASFTEYATSPAE